VTRRFTVPAVALALAAMTIALARTRGTAPRAIPPAGGRPVHSASEIRELDIAFWQRRAAEDRSSAADRSRVAALYLERARELGNHADYQRAEEWARASLRIRGSRNASTYQSLAAALLAQHRFSDALETARALVAIEPDEPGYEALLAEIELEMGRYADADRRFARLETMGDRLSVAARLARWYEISGKPDAARGVLVRATGRLSSRADLPREQVAWFSYRLGDLELRRGRLEQADTALRRALAIFPADYRAFGALARLELARGRWREAIAWGDRAIAIQLDPATLGAMSDAFSALGDSMRAEEYAQAMSVAALSQPGPIHRAWGLFLLDHGREARQVLSRARADIATRHDVYGEDLLAWALFRNGLVTEARAAARRALARGTVDPQLFYHAGMIERALGHQDDARTLLERAALSTGVTARQARLALDSLARPRSRV
jgi:tetratricopeptide (TPR) repeat protein